ncbi:MAG: galactokinase [Aigarchaeota archaeon]|nr:galactokinase [Aigarchaeota archaeon]
MSTLRELSKRVTEDSQYDALGLIPAGRLRKKRIWQRIVETLAKNFAVSRDEEVYAYFIPGRVEVLGKHTDYAGGKSLLMALDRGFQGVSRANKTTKIRIMDTNPRYGLREFEFPARLQPSMGDWANYPMTVVQRIEANFASDQELRGVDIVFASDLPAAGGMGSSSALMVLTFLAVGAPNELFEDPRYKENICNNIDLAMYLACVENGQTFRSLVGGRGVGTFGGSEDHTAMLTSKSGMLSLFEFCLTRHIADIQFPSDLAMVVAQSGIKSEKTGDAKELYNLTSRRANLVVSYYNERYGTKHTVMRDIVVEKEGRSRACIFDRVRRALAKHRLKTRGLDLAGRFAQFYQEDRVYIPQAVAALVSRDYARLGQAIDQSHAASKQSLKNIVPEVDYLQRKARRLGAVAASGFGAGFGGSAYALVHPDQNRNFLLEWRSEYLKRFPERRRSASFFSVTASRGATRLFTSSS